MKNRFTKLAVALGAVGLMAGAMQAQAQAQDKIKIGYISDLSSLYADLEGKDAATAIQMAIDDFGGKVLGKPIEMMSFDHQNKPDLAASKAREWIDTDGLTMIFSGTNSGTALALAKVSTEKKRVMINNGAGTSALTNEQCSPYAVHYAYDTVALSRGSAGAVVANGGKSWFFLTADYAFGHAMEADAAAVVKEKGHGRGHRAPPAQCDRFFFFPAAGAELQGAGARFGECRWRHHQRHQGSQRIRHLQDHEGGAAAGVLQ